MKKTTLYGLLILLLVGINVGQYLQREKPPKHRHRVGGIDIPKDHPKDSVVPDWYRGAYQTYSSAAPYVFKQSKYRFRQKLYNAVNDNGFSDSGYLTLRFFLNPKGEVILHEVIEMNLDLEKKDLEDALVTTIKTESFKPEHWMAYKDSIHNYYMHLTYRIENGKITEIIP